MTRQLHPAGLPPEDDLPSEDARQAARQVRLKIETMLDATAKELATGALQDRADEAARQAKITTKAYNTLISLARDATPLVDGWRELRQRAKIDFKLSPGDLEAAGQAPLTHADKMSIVRELIELPADQAGAAVRGAFLDDPPDLVTAAAVEGVVPWMHEKLQRHAAVDVTELRGELRARQDPVGAALVKRAQENIHHRLLLIGAARGELVRRGQGNPEAEDRLDQELRPLRAANA